MLHNAKIEAVKFLGRKAIRVTTVTSRQGWWAGFARSCAERDFQDGAIEADIAVKITTPPGVRMPGFTGLAFRMKADGSCFEECVPASEECARR